MIPPDNDVPDSGPKMKGFDPIRKPRAVRMNDPEMTGRRERTREGRERKRSREQRPKLCLILGSGIVLITLIGLTAWNVLSRKADTNARSQRAKTALDTALDTTLDTTLDTQRDPVSDATLEAEATAVLPEDRAEVVDSTNSTNSAAFRRPVKTTVSEKQRSLESARDRYLARSVSGAGDSASGAAGKADADGEAADGEADTIDEAEKERVLRKVMPFYRTPKERDAPPVPADELYLPEKK